MTGAIGSERGSATLWVLVVVALLLAAGATVIGYGGAVIARHRAGSAADLAALAAAAESSVAVGPVAACGRAREVAAAQGATLLRCGLDGLVAEVVVTVPVVHARLRLPPAIGRARAGPVNAGQ